tara:strand:- start:192 stop:371 length:180 start_codon:yes stop_codon:yes gene_type:complete
MHKQFKSLQHLNESIEDLDRVLDKVCNGEAGFSELTQQSATVTHLYKLWKNEKEAFLSD